MHTVKSTDGTIISYEKSGTGPPLVLLHGAGLDLKFWDLSGVRSSLEEHATVYAVDRRGRHESSDGQVYSLDREIEDVAALVDMIGEPVTLLGHSYGALIALEAGPRVPNLRGLIIYEPFTLEEGIPFLQHHYEEIQGMLARGEKEQALIYDLSGVAMPEDAFEAYRSYPSWPKIVDAADTLPREYKALIEYRFDDQKFKSLTTPTLLLMGGAEPPPLVEATKTIHRTLPDSRLVVFDGHGHWAMNSATDRFIEEVTKFIHELG